MFNVINTFIFLLIIAGCIVLQVYLSKRQSKWLGLILPGIFLLVSLIAVFSITAYTTMTVTENGKTVEKIVSAKDWGSVILQSVVVFAECNIPTIILLGIYAGCREKKKKKAELEKMNIQDLE